MSDRPADLIRRGLAGLLGSALDAILEATPEWQSFRDQQDLIETLLTQTKEAIVALQDTLNDLSAKFTDYNDDVTAKLAELAQQQAAMQQTLEAATSNDAAQNAMIADLQSQLAAMVATTEAAQTQAQSIADAIAAADVAVDRPAPAPTPEPEA